MRFEKFKNVIIPVDNVVFAEYIPKNDNPDELSNVTVVNVLIPNSFVTNPIVISGNCLEEFLVWINKKENENADKAQG